MTLVAVEFNFSNNTDRVNVFSSGSIKLSGWHSIAFLIKSGIRWFGKKSHQFNCIRECWSIGGIFGYLWPNIIKLLRSWGFQIFISWEIGIWKIIWWWSPESRNSFWCLLEIVFWNIMKFVESIISILANKRLVDLS